MFLYKRGLNLAVMTDQRTDPYIIKLKKLINENEKKTELFKKIEKQNNN